MNDGAGRGVAEPPALAALVPYEPGKPVEEVQRELGLERVVKLASNEGPSDPSPRRRRSSPAPLSSSTGTRTAAPGVSGAPLPSGTASRFEQVRCAPAPTWSVGYVSQALARTGRRGGHRVALVSELRARPAQAWRRPRYACRSVDERIDLEALFAAITPRTSSSSSRRRTIRPGRRRGRGARRVLRARAPARSHGARPGVLRVPGGTWLPGCGSRSTLPPDDGCSSSARSPRSTGWPACGSATASGPTR